MRLVRLWPVTGRVAPDAPGDTRPELPRGLLLGTWVGASARGEVGPDDMSDAVTGSDARHLVLDRSGVHELSALMRLLEHIVGVVREVRVAVCAPGDPAGLAGPPDFNTAAIDAGSAAVVAGDRGSVGLVPQWDARTIVWHLHAAHLPPTLDPAEASRDLRRELTLAATSLAAAGVAEWQPEIPDLLLNLGARARPHLPAAYDGSRLQIIERALVALEIVDLAPGHPALGSLARAARRVLVASCSDTLGRS